MRQRDDPRAKPPQHCSSAAQQQSSAHQQHDQQHRPQQRQHQQQHQQRNEQPQLRDTSGSVDSGSSSSGSSLSPHLALGGEGSLLREIAADAATLVQQQQQQQQWRLGGADCISFASPYCSAHLSEEQQQQQQSQHQQKHEDEEEGENAEGENSYSSAEDTPVVVFGRCRSSDGWRHSSTSSSEDSSLGSSKTHSHSLDFIEAAAAHSACPFRSRGAAEEKADAAEAGPWIREAVRYMELVVECSSSGSSSSSSSSSCSGEGNATAATAAAAASSSCCCSCSNSSSSSSSSSRIKGRLPMCSRSLELSQQHLQAETEPGASRRPRCNTATADLPLGRVCERAEAAGSAADEADEGEAMQQVHVRVLQLYRQLQQIATQVKAEECDCKHCPCIQEQQQQTSTKAACVRDNSSSLSCTSGSCCSGSMSSNNSSRICACCAFSSPLRIGAALSHLYSENPAHFSLLLHDSVLLALLPLQRHAAAALADAVLQQPSPLASLLGEGGLSRLLEETAAATAAEVVAAGAAVCCSSSCSSGSNRSRSQQQPQQQRRGAVGVSTYQKAVAAAFSRNSSSSSSSILSVVSKSKRRSWPDSAEKQQHLGEVASSYSCCGAPLCRHKRAAAKRFLERQQRQQLLHKPLGHAAPQHKQQQQQQKKQQQQVSDKDAEALSRTLKREPSEQRSPAPAARAAAAKTVVACFPAAAAVAAAAEGSAVKAVATAGEGSAAADGSVTEGSAAAGVSVATEVSVAVEGSSGAAFAAVEGSSGAAFAAVEGSSGAAFAAVEGSSGAAFVAVEGSCTADAGVSGGSAAADAGVSEGCDAEEGSAVAADAAVAIGRLVSGGVGSSVDQYDLGAEACAGCARIEQQLRLFNSSTEPPLSLGQYVTRLQHLASATEHEMLMALLLLTHLQQRQQQLRISKRNAHRLLLAALVLVSKVVRDTHTPLALWAVVGGVSSRELASLEVALLELVGHRVSFSFPEFAAAYCLAAALSRLQQQQNRHQKQQKQQQQQLQLPQQLQDTGAASAEIGRQRTGTEDEEKESEKEEDAAAAVSFFGETKMKANMNKDINPGGVSGDAACGLSNSRMNSQPDSIKSLSLKPSISNASDDTLARARCTNTVAALPRPALQTNPILRRLVELQGDASWL